MWVKDLAGSSSLRSDTSWWWVTLPVWCGIVMCQVWTSTKPSGPSPPPHTSRQLTPRHGAGHVQSPDKRFTNDGGAEASPRCARPHGAPLLSARGLVLPIVPTHTITPHHRSHLEIPAQSCGVTRHIERGQVAPVWRDSRNPHPRHAGPAQRRPRQQQSRPPRCLRPSPGPPPPHHRHQLHHFRRPRPRARHPDRPTHQFLAFAPSFAPAPITIQ